MSTLDGEAMRATGTHTYTDGEATWYEIMDGLPKFNDDRNSE